MEATLVCGTYVNQATLEYAMYHLRNVGFLDANFTVVCLEAVFEESPNPGRADMSPKSSTGSAEFASAAGVSELLDRAIRKGEIVLTVQCDDAEQALIARKILEGTGAESVSSSRDASTTSPTLFHSIGSRSVA